MNARKIKAGEAFVEARLDNTKFGRDVKKIQAKLQGIAARAQKISKALGSASRNVLSFGATSTAALAVASGLFAKTGDELNTISKETGVAVQTMSEYHFVAKQTRTPVDNLNAGIKEMALRLSEAKDGTGSMFDMLTKMGLKAEDIQRMGPEKAFLAIVDAINKLPKEDQIFAIDEMFGGDGENMINFIRLGSDGIREMQKEARSLGVTMSKEGAESAAKMSSAISILTQQGKMAVIQIGAALAPAITELAGNLKGALSTSIQWIKENQGAIKAIAVLTAGIFGLGAALMTGSVALGLVAFGLTKVVALMGLLLSPINIAIALFVGVTGAVLHFTGALDDLLDSGTETFSKLWETSSEFLGGITKALMRGDVKAAADVLWAGLKLIWVKGVRELKLIWSGIKITFFEVIGSIERGWIKGTSMLQRSWTKTVSFVKRLWIEFSSSFGSTWDGIVNEVAKGLLKLQGKFDKTLNVDTASQILDEDMARKEAQRQREKHQSLAEISTNEQRDLEASRGRESALLSRSRTIEEQLRKDSTVKIGELNSELKAARKAYEKALKAAEGQSGPKAIKRSPILDPFGDTSSSTGQRNLPNLPQMAASAISRGGFSARAFAAGSGTGVNPVVNQIKDLQGTLKKQAEQIKQEIKRSSKSGR